MRDDRRDRRRTYEPASVAGRVPPHDLDAEAVVLSAILLSRAALDQVAGVLRTEHFYSDANARIYEAAQQLAEAGTPVDVATVAARLRDYGRLEQVGGASYLAQLADETPAVAHVDAHAMVVHEKWRLRQLIATCQKIAAEGYGDVGVISEFMDAAESALLEITSADDSDDGLTTLGDAIVNRAKELISDEHDATWICTGLTDIDRILGPMRDGNFIIIAAHSGVGKTTLGMQIAQHVAIHQRVPHRGKKVTPGVLAFSMEMTAAELADRAALSALQIDTSKAARGALSGEELTQFSGFAERIATKGLLRNVWIDERGSRTPRQIRSVARRVKLRAEREGHPLAAIVLDYAQLVDGATGQTGGERREREVAMVSRSLKQLAKELCVPLIAMAQLNEDARNEKRLPRGEDLRECKALRADADKIILLYNESAFERRTAERDEKSSGPLLPEMVDVIIDKNRGGQEGATCVMLHPSTSAFSCADHDDKRRHYDRRAASKADPAKGKKR